jgi:hypothetical protein
VQKPRECQHRNTRKSNRMDTPDCNRRRCKPLISLKYENHPANFTEKEEIARSVRCISGGRRTLPISKSIEITKLCATKSYQNPIPIIPDLREHPDHALNLQQTHDHHDPRGNPPTGEIPILNRHLVAKNCLKITLTSIRTRLARRIPAGIHGCEDSQKVGFIQREVQVR